MIDMALSLYRRVFVALLSLLFLAVFHYVCMINLSSFCCYREGDHGFGNCSFRFATSEVFFNHVFVEIYDEANETLAIRHASLLALGAKLAQARGRSARAYYSFRCHLLTYIVLSLLTCGDIHPIPGSGQAGLQMHQLTPASINNTMLQVIPTAANGHCFVYALCISIETFLNIRMSYHEIIRSLQNELIINEGLYMGFFSKPVDVFRQQARQYFQQKFYNSDFGDLLPLISANEFELQLIISASPRL